MNLSRQELAEMIVDSCMRYDHRWAESVCRYCGRSDWNIMKNGHSEDCEINMIRTIANGSEEQTE